MAAPDVKPEPAPEYLKPTPSPLAVAQEQAEAAEKAQEAETPTLAPVVAEMPAPTPQINEDEVEELSDELDPTRTWKVRCPRCGKELTARETSPYHRCPVCDKVFQLRKFRTYTRKD